MVAGRACIVAGLDRPELALDLLRNKPEHHGKGEQTAQEDEVHEQSCRQRRFLCHLGTCLQTTVLAPLTKATLAALRSASYEHLAKSSVATNTNIDGPDSSTCWLLTKVSKLSKLGVKGVDTHSSPLPGPTRQTTDHTELPMIMQVLSKHACKHRNQAQVYGTAQVYIA